jgi:hypothetical protein
MSPRRLLSIAAVAFVCISTLVPAAGCGSDVALDKVIEITDVHSGYTDMGIVQGETRLVPTAVIRVKNNSGETLSGFQLSASFWLKGGDGEKDEIILQHLVAKSLAPGATSDPIVIRANFGYKLEGARADFFAHSQFVDFVIKVFGKINGRPYKIGELSVDRTILQKDATDPTK